MEKYSQADANDWYEFDPLTHRYPRDMTQYASNNLYPRPEYEPKTVVSLFAGCGGKTLGAIANGYNPIYAHDINPYAAELYRKNIGDIEIGDILDDPDVPASELLLASPSCKSYSGANVYGRETENDISISKQVARIIERNQPRKIMIENVSKYFKSKAFSYIKLMLQDIGYFYRVERYDMSYYGVPQTRYRGILTASLEKMPQRLEISTYPSCGQSGWFSRLPDVSTEEMEEIELALWQKRSIDAYNLVLPHICIISKSGSSSRLQVKNWDEPCFTIKAMSGNVRPNPNQAVIKIGGRFFKPDTYAIAAIQTFPENYLWGDSFRQNIEAIGNAVPPIFAKQVVATLD